MVDKSEIGITFLMGALIYFLSIFLVPVYKTLWLTYVYTDTITLGYVYIVVSALAIIGVAITSKAGRKYARWTNAFTVTFIFTFIIGMFLIFPMWFNSIWVF